MFHFLYVINRNKINKKNSLLFIIFLNFIIVNIILSASHYGISGSKI